MPELNEGDKTSEDTKVEESKEEFKEEKSEETSEETEDDGEKQKPSEKKEEIEEEPKKRFPSSEDNKLGYKFRKLQEENKRLKEKYKEEGLELEDEEDDNKPVSRKELQELLERKDRQSTSERMLSEFLIENPDFRKYEKTLRKYVNDPDYSNIPIGFIANGIVGEHLDDEANERADLKRKADEEADKTKSGGSSKRITPGSKKNVWDMSKEEFEEYQAGVLRSKF